MKCQRKSFLGKPQKLIPTKINYFTIFCKKSIKPVNCSNEVKTKKQISNFDYSVVSLSDMSCKKNAKHGISKH